MTAGTGYVPAAVIECPYTPRMTRAAAQALAAGAGLKENCVVVITDGPTIGTAGNTSVTEIELNPVSATAFGQTARVFTTFSPDAWPGVYDITNNTITELRDDFGNTAKDIDNGGATVETQFPWHLGGLLFRDNYVEDSTLIGWDTQVGILSNNRVINSVINLTGKTGGTVLDNVFQGTGVVLGAGGGSANVSRSQFYGANPVTIHVNHTGAGQISYADSIQRDGFLVAASGAGLLTVSNSTLQNHGTAPADIQHAGGGSVSVLDSVVTGRGDASPAIDYQAGATGGVSITRSQYNGSRMTKTAGSTGVVTVTGSEITDATITIGAANAATTNTFQNVIVQQSVFSLLGPLAGGRNDFTVGAFIRGSAVNVAATATAGVAMTGGEYDAATVNQNRTAGTQSMTLFSCDVRGFSTITDNGTTDPTQGLLLNRIKTTDAAVNVGNIAVKTAPGTILQQCDFTGATINVTGLAAAAFLNRVRVYGGALTNAGFDGSDLIIDGSFIKTMGAAQLNRLCNKSFDDWI